MADKETFGERLKRLRKKQGLTQPELAFLVGVHETTIRRWENKENEIPNIKDIKKLAAALNVTEDELLNGVPEQGGWVLQIKIATEFKEEIIDMRGQTIPVISNLTCTPKGGGFSLYGDYDMWVDTKKFKALIKQLEQARQLVLQNGKALGGIKEE